MELKMRKFKVTLTEDELKAVISHLCYGSFDFTTERSSRIHELTKKLNKSVELTEAPEEEQSEEKEQGTSEKPASAVSGW